MGYNAGVSDEMIEVLQHKSLDPFVFLRRKLGKMI
jgi:hypothetical protein